jgi:HicB family.
MEIKRITIRVPPELHQRLSQLAADRSVSLNTLAVEALEAYTESLAAEQERFPLTEQSPHAGEDARAPRMHVVQSFCTSL